MLKEWVEMKKKVVSGVMLTLLLIGLLTLAFNVQTVKADLKTIYRDDDSFVNPWNGNLDHSYQDVTNGIECVPTSDLDSIDNGTYYYEENSIRVIEHKITTLEWKGLKQKVGVWEESRDYNQIIDGHGTGVRTPTQEEWTEILEAYVVDEVLWRNQMADSPSSVDHTNSSWFPPIGNQDGEGSCVAWAVGYYMKTFQEAKEHGWNLSGAVWEGGYKGHPTQAYQNRIFSPDFIYHQINDGEDYGSCYSDAIDLVCFIGVCSWEEMPYDPDDHTGWPSESAWREAPLYRGNSTGIQYMWIDTDTDITDLKNWIASDHLAVIGIDSRQYSHLTSGDVWTLDNYIDPNTNHANTIVGYDDDLEYTESGEIRYGAFKVANSWGVGWSGDHNHDGCYWISYEAMKQCLGYCMLYHDKIGYEPELVATFRVDHSKRGECDITVCMGNESTPIQTKRFDDWICGDGGDHPFCSNDIVLDITEFKEVVPTLTNQSFFMEVYDGGSSTTGTISSFSSEYYHNYSSGVLCANSTSNDVPVNTTNHDYVFAELTLRISIPSDVTGDEIVDVEDLTICALALWSELGDPDWNPIADLNSDGIIDIVDLVTIGINYGKTW